MADRICLVAGASRGLGRGIARGLGEAGATVVVSARSSETGPRTDGRPETIEDTARLVDEAGGRGVHYVCDHTRELEVDRLVGWTLRRFGRIDLAVCAVWGGNEGFDGTRYPDGATWGAPFWRRASAPFGQAMESGPYAALLLARAVAGAMVAAKGGLIALVSFGTEEGYLGDIVYDLSKAATNRLAVACAAELAPHGVAVVALSPGSVRTERVIEAGLAPDAGESPLYAGRALAALAADPQVRAESGRTLYVADLAERYGVSDVDGTRPGRFVTPDMG